MPGSPGHEHWQRTCTHAAGLFSVVFDERYSSAKVDAFIDALRLFKIGYSWAGPVSLAVPYHVPAMRSKAIAQAGVLVRFSIGLEAVDDLIADLEQALAAAAGIGARQAGFEPSPRASLISRPLRCAKVRSRCRSALRA